MSETPFTPAETAYIESGGQTELPAETPAVETTTDAESTEPTAVETTDAKPAEEKPQEKFVPYGALHEERERRKELAAQVQAANERAARLEERMNILLQPTKPAEVAPSLEEDPVAYFKHKDEERAREIAELKQNNQQSVEQAQVIQQQQQIISAYRASVGQIAQEAPDFKDAYDYIVESRKSELAAAYPQARPEAIIRAIQEEEFTIARNALNEGRNPAKAIYDMAKARGYAPKPKGEDAAGKIDRIAAGQQESKSLAGATGAPSGEIGVDQLVSMTDAEFMKAVESGQFRKVAGG